VATVLHGVQTWVALPGEVEDGEAWFQHTSRDDLPADGDDRARVRLVAGEGWGMRSPVAVSSALVLAELRLAGGKVELDARPPERGVLALHGRITIDGRPLEEGRLAVVEPGRRPLVGGEGRAVVLGGEPVGKRFIWWNFVHSSQDRIEEAKRDWTAQRFPLVPDDHDPWVPLPGA
jgi:redox-sensitive bicupin YhaK (pirin superfamily)